MIGILYLPQKAQAATPLCGGILPLCPVLGQYRMVDFALSNLANASIGTVGVIAAPEAQSALASYLGVGQEWDLDRRRGGITWLQAGPEGSGSQTSFLAKQTAAYVILADASLAWTVSCRELLYTHLESGCDVTALRPAGQAEPGLYLLSRGLLLTLLEQSHPDTAQEFSALLTSSSLTCRQIEFSAPCLSATSPEDYYRRHLALLETANLDQLFPVRLPVHTRQQDDEPARFGPQAQTDSSLIAGACTILGHVEHSVIFRGCQIGAGARVCQCVLLPGCQVEAGAVLQNVLAGEACRIPSHTRLEGSGETPIILEKGSQL